MRSQASAESQDEVVEFAGSLSWLAIALAVVPGLVVLQSAYVLIVKPVPWPLIMLMLPVMGACALLAAKALEGILATTVTLSPQGIAVTRALGSQSFSWMDIEDVKLVPAPGTFADNPAHNLASRIGIGVFLRANAKDREDPNLADEVLFVGSEEDTSRLLGIMERINLHRNRKLTRTAPPRIGAKRVVAGGGVAEFRRAAQG